MQILDHTNEKADEHVTWWIKRYKESCYNRCGVIALTSSAKKVPVFTFLQHSEDLNKCSQEYVPHNEPCTTHLIILCY